MNQRRPRQKERPAQELLPSDLMPEPAAEESTKPPVDRPADTEVAASREVPNDVVDTPSAASIADSAPAEEPVPAEPATPPVPDVSPAKPAVPASLADRVRPDRLQSVIEQGGSRETEQAVGRAPRVAGARAVGRRTLGC